MSYEKTFDRIDRYIKRVEKWEEENPKKELSFEEQIRKIQDERHRNEWWAGKRRVERGEYIYVSFCVWCNAFNYGNGKNDAKLFAKFLKQQKIELTFWQRKHLAEKYFGYKYEYNHDKGDWEIKKINKESDNGD